MKNNGNSLSAARNLLILCLLLAVLLLVIVPKKPFKDAPIFGQVTVQVTIISSNPPTFDFTLLNQTINQSSEFILDVNCSDVDVGDIITYYGNFSGFEINGSTGMINKTNFSQSYVGNQTIKIICGDGKLNTSENFVLQILNINEPPILSDIGPQIATEGILFTLDIDASDIDADNLSFSVATTIFSINSATGIVNFTPSLETVGNYTINFSVFDGELYDYEIVSFRIVRGAFCGDGSCGSSESCSSCSTDCGACASQSSSDSGSGDSGEGSSDSGGGGSEGGGGLIAELGGSARAQYIRCDEKWECSDWQSCSISGEKKRSCIEVNKCGTKRNKPIEVDTCEYLTSCNDGIKNGGEEGVDCGGDCNPCFVENCFDGKQNQDEAGIDCGGICRPCEEKKFAKLPILEIPQSLLELPRRFPWAFAFLASSIIALALASDQIYVMKIKKKKFDEFKKEFEKHKKIRQRIRKASINVAAVTLVLSLYIYFFSDSLANLIRFSWIPAALLVLAPLSVAYLMSKFSYREYKKRKKEQMLNETHRREVIQMMFLESKILLDIESKLKENIHSMLASGKFSASALDKQFYPIEELLSSIVNKRSERIELSKTGSEIFGKFVDLLNNNCLLKFSQDYAEFFSIRENLKKLQENINMDCYNIEQDLAGDIREISKPHMKSVIRASDGAIFIYNILVDVYTYLMAKFNNLSNIDAESIALERAFIDKAKEISKNPQFIDIIQKDSALASVYNSSIDLVNHYLKRQEMGAKVKLV